MSDYHSDRSRICVAESIQANDAYHSKQSLSSSEIADYLDDPIDWYFTYRLRTRKKPEPTDAMKLGTSVHLVAEIGLPRMIADGGWSNILKSIPKEVLNSEGHCKGKAWTEWKAANPADVYIKPGEPNPLAEIWDNLVGNKWCYDVLHDANSLKEHEIEWDDPLLGPCRLKADLLNMSEEYVVDWKTTRAKTARKFAADAAAMHYDVRLAFYRRGIHYSLGFVPAVYIVAINTSGGYEVTPYEMPEEWLDDADARLVFAVEEMRTFDLGKYRDKPVQRLAQPKWNVLKEEDL